MSDPRELRMRPKYVSIIVASGRDVAERWHRQYFLDQGNKWYSHGGDDREAKYKRLCELGSDPDIAKVAEIIGNKSWSYITCDGCGDEGPRAVQIGQYEPKTYCRICLTEALTVLDREP